MVNYNGNGKGSEYQCQDETAPSGPGHSATPPNGDNLENGGSVPRHQSQLSPEGGAPGDDGRALTEQELDDWYARSDRSWIDLIADRLIEAIRPGWKPGRLSAHLGQLYASLGAEKSLTEEMALQHAQTLARKLRKDGYAALPPAEYRKQILRAKQRAAEEAKERLAIEKNSHRAVQGAEQAGTILPPPFMVVDQNTLSLLGQPEEPDNWGIYDNADYLVGKRLCNFALVLDEEVAVEDEFDGKKLFRSWLDYRGRRQRFEIAAKDYADNNKLRAAMFDVGGARLEIACRMDQLRTAVSSLSANVRTSRTTTSFGWDDAGQAYLVPGGRVTAAGFEPAGDDEELRVDLGGEEQARHLGMRPLPPQDLQRLKRHVVQDLLALHDRRVTYALLGSAAAAVLHRFAGGANRYALWLTGLTGSGKTHAAQLFMNFFGDFPAGSGRCVTWASTPNYVQREGYFFKDALYLVDDYKPEVTYNAQVVRVLQNYSDGTGRGRLKVDATTNTTRPIRGLLVSTGEDHPEQSASSTARSIIIKVPQSAKDVARGGRCVAESRNYGGVTADFVRHLLAEGRTRAFAGLVACLRAKYYRGVAGRQNDVRVAGNLALLAAGFVEAAMFLADVWPGWKGELRWFLDEELPALRGEMLGLAQEQQASEVFWQVLAELLHFGVVGLDGLTGGDGRVIGKTVDQHHYYISTSLALEAVQESLRRQGRPPLKCTERALLEQLRADGKALDPGGRPSQGPALATRNVRIAQAQRKCFLIDKDDLLGAAGALVPQAPIRRRRAASPVLVPPPPTRTSLAASQATLTARDSTGAATPAAAK